MCRKEETEREKVGLINLKYYTNFKEVSQRTRVLNIVYNETHSSEKVFSF